MDIRVCCTCCPPAVVRWRPALILLDAHQRVVVCSSPPASTHSAKPSISSASAMGTALRHPSGMATCASRPSVQTGEACAGPPQRRRARRRRLGPDRVGRHLVARQMCLNDSLAQSRCLRITASHRDRKRLSRRPRDLPTKIAAPAAVREPRNLRRAVQIVREQRDAQCVGHPKECQ